LFGLIPSASAIALKQVKITSQRYIDFIHQSADGVCVSIDSFAKHNKQTLAFWAKHAIGQIISPKRCATLLQKRVHQSIKVRAL
jgi:hypothetical protein